MALASGIWDFTLIRGASWAPTIKLFRDAAQTQPKDLTGYSVEVHFEDASEVVLTSGAGEVTIDGAAGTIVPQLASDVSSGLGKDKNEVRWYLKLIDPNGGVSFPLRGTVYPVTP